MIRVTNIEFRHWRSLTIGVNPVYAVTIHYQDVLGSEEFTWEMLKTEISAATIKDKLQDFIQAREARIQWIEKLNVELLAP